MKKLPAILLLLVSCWEILGQTPPHNYFERHYLFQQRLAQGLVFDILQDQTGFMWFATEYGLVRFDGKNLLTHQQEPGNAFSLAGNVVTCLAEDAKSNLWVGTMNSGLHYFDRQTNQFRRYQHDPQDDRSIGNNKINDVLVTKSGSVWVATEGGGVNLFDKETETFQQIGKTGPKSMNTNALLEDEAEQLWLGAFYGLSQWQQDSNAFIFQADARESAINSVALRALAQDDGGRIWAGFKNGGLQFIDQKSKQFQRVVSAPDWPVAPGDNHIWDIYAAKGGHLWVGTDSSLYHLEKQQHAAPLLLSRYTFTTERRYLSICESTDGVMWIGTNHGVVVLAPKQKQFRLMTPLKAGESTTIKRGGTAMCEATGDQFWVGTIRGLFQCDIDGPRFHQDFLVDHPLLTRFESTNIPSIYQDQDDNLWIGIIDGFNMGFGVFHYDLVQKQLTNFTPRSLHFSSYVTFSITEDRDGQIWFGNGNGLLHYTPATDSLRLFAAGKQRNLHSNKTNILLNNPPEQLFIGTNDAGLAIYNQTTREFTGFQAYFGAPTHAANRRVLCMHLDKQEQLWLGTAGGLLHFNDQTQSFRNFDKNSGLADNVIKAIQEDDRGHLWVGSQTSISRFDPQAEVFINYNNSDGVELDEIWDRASYQDRTGRLYFGGDDGILVFHPDSIRQNNFVPPIVYTRFLLFNQEVVPDPGSKVLPLPLELAPTITLQHNQNVFTIHFAALTYINPQKTQYAVMMEGFEEDWQMIGNRTEATYTNLNPGSYNFQVRAANNDGIWNEEGATLRLVVLPPWYRTWWAYALYFILISGSIYFVYRFQLNRRLAEVETQRLRELDEVKTRLYTNITHEFRTPLTLIQGPVARALDEPEYTLGQQELERIRRNCRRLLTLIQQVLNLNKLEAGALRPDYRYGDVIFALKYIVDAFHSLAESQQITLSLKVPEDQLFMDFDQEKLFDILSNLLSNAIKFTPENGKVLVTAQEAKAKNKSMLEVAVSDTGPGIPPGEVDKVFDRFYQVTQEASQNQDESQRSGTGIGLALSRRLAELMGGTLSVRSEPGGKGSTFYLHLPIRHTKKGIGQEPSRLVLSIPSEPSVEESFSVEKASALQDVPAIVIVEDNADVARFVAECLPDHFHKVIAKNGKEGIELAQEYIPDLVISDVLMPKVDGFSLTEKLKQDQRTSHIPIILLTAKADFDSRMEGLGKGADAYMAKPFSRQELLIRVENLLESRRRLQAYYLEQSGLATPAKEEKTAPQEHIFLKKVRQLIEKNLDREGHSVEALADDLHMSTAQLYRKIKALTGRSTSKFIRHIQITRAKHLLENTQHTISEIAYRSGFNDPAYFTRVFTAETGEPPSAYRNK